MSQVIGVFKGGGAKGVLYSGALQAVRDRGISFSQVAGSSAGAITAAFVAAGATPEDLRRIARDGHDLLKMPSSVSSALNLRNRFGILPFEDLRDWIAKNLIELLEVNASRIVMASGAGRGPTFAEMHDAGAVPLHIAGADLHWRSPVVFNAELTPLLPVAEAAAASSAVPFVFAAPRLYSTEERTDISGEPDGTAQRRDDSRRLPLLSDGGVMANLPLFIFTDPGYRRVAGLDPMPDDPKPQDDRIVAFSFVDTETPRHTTPTGEVGDAYRQRFARAVRATPFLGLAAEILRESGLDRAAQSLEVTNRAATTSGAEDTRGGGAIRRASARTVGSIRRAAAWTLDLFLRALEFVIIPPITLILALTAHSPVGAVPLARRAQHSRTRRWARFADGVFDLAPGYVVIGIILIVPVLIFGIPDVVEFLWPDWSNLVAGKPISEWWIQVLLVCFFLLLAWTGLLVVVVLVVLGLVAYMVGWVTKPVMTQVGPDLVATFMRNPQEPPWAGAGDREVIIRLDVPKGWTLLESTDNDDALEKELEEVRKSVDEQLQRTGLGTSPLQAGERG